MQILINGDYKIIFVGPVFSGEPAEDDYLFSVDDELPLVVRSEIVESNKLNVDPKNSTAFFEAILSTFRGINMSITKKLKQEVIKMHRNPDVPEQDALVHLVTNGIPFGKAIHVFNEILEESGDRISMKSIQEVIDKCEFLKNDKGEIEWNAVENMLEKAREAFPKAEEKAIMGCIRKHFRGAGHAFPRKAKRVVAVGRRIYQWIIDNPLASDEDLVAFVVEECEKPAKYANRWLNMMRFGREYVAGYKKAKKAQKEG